MNASVFDIQRFSIHDGPGIRTTIFFKGCPLRCAWCQNPESISPYPVELFDKTRCVGCDHCREARSCPANARRTAGDNRSIDDLLRQTCRDQPFYGNDGGVTFCGGEPLMQWPAVRGLADQLRNEGIHCALDTCASASERIIQEVPDHFDLIIADLKAVSPDLHRQWTGADNARILAAIERWSMVAPNRLWISLPLVPGVHSTEEIHRMARFIAQLPASPAVRLIPYHKAGLAKYQQLGSQVRSFLGDMAALLDEARDILSRHHILLLAEPTE